MFTLVAMRTASQKALRINTENTWLEHGDVHELNPRVIMKEKNRLNVG